MNYLQTPIYSETHSPQSLDNKQHRQLVQFTRKNVTCQNSPQKLPSNDLSMPKIQYSHGKNLRPLIKVNKNLQNAFPHNFFSNQKHSIPSGSKKQQPFHQKCFQLNLQEIPSFSTNLQDSQKPVTKCQSIQLRKLTIIDSQVSFQDKDHQTRLNKFKISSQKSSRTSIQKKHNITFCFEKAKDQNLPQTAQTLENIDEQQLFNVTFGIAFTKQNTPNQSSLYLGRIKHEQNKAEKQQYSYRLKNTVSLQLKRRVERTSTKKTQQKSQFLRRVLFSQNTGSMSQRKHSDFQQNKPKITTNKHKPSQENPFMKIKLDIEQILNKKTSILPKVNNSSNQNTRKQQRVIKLGKL